MICDCAKRVEFREFNFCQLTFLATQEEAKDFAAVKAKGCIYCSIYVL